MLRYIFILLLYSVASIGQSQMNYGIKLGGTNSLNRFRSSGNYYLSKKPLESFAFLLSKNIKDFRYSIELGYNQHEYDIYVRNIPLVGLDERFELGLLRSVINYNATVNIGYKVWKHANWDITMNVMPNVSLYSYNKIFSGFNYLRPTTIDDNIYLSYFDPTFLPFTYNYKTYITINPKVGFEFTKTFKKWTICIGSEFEFYLNELPKLPLQMQISSDLYPDPLYYEYNSKIKPITGSIYFKIGHRIRTKKSNSKTKHPEYLKNNQHM